MQKDIWAFLIKIKIPLVVLAILWLIGIADFIFGIELTYYGIYPREISGLIGIFTSPFIHSNWGHLLSNTYPVLGLMSIMAIFYPKVAFQAYVNILIGTGFMVWLFGRESYHIGASGMVYGLATFVMGTGIFKKNLKSIILSLVVLTLYSGIFTNMFPNAEPHISWESHLFGGIVGLITAFILKSVIEDDEEEYLKSPWEGDDMSKTYFLPRDTFAKTKMQRYQEFLEAERQRIAAINALNNQNTLL